MMGKGFETGQMPCAVGCESKVAQEGGREGIAEDGMRPEELRGPNKDCAKEVVLCTNGTQGQTGTELGGGWTNS